MPRKSKKPVKKQTHSPTGKVVGQVGQILLPMIAGIAATKADLTEYASDTTAMYKAYESRLFRFDQLYRHFCENADVAAGHGWTKPRIDGPSLLSAMPCGTKSRKS